MRHDYLSGVNGLTRVRFFSIVEGRLEQIEARMRDCTNGHNPELQAALDHILSSGGKRVRPAVTVLMGSLLGADDDHLISLAAAIELLHTATLVHDDLIDGSLLRRGTPTLNSEWTPAATVLAGDYVFARAASLAADTDSVEVMKIFAQTLATIVNGEINQLFSGRRNINRQEYYDRIYSKTASMFVLATTAAAILGDSDQQMIDRVNQFGYGTGMAFQIVDDILDFTGEQAAIGKPVASDLRQGLVTLPAIYYLEDFPNDPDMHELLGSSYPGDELVGRVVTSIRNSGAIERSFEEAKTHVYRGIQALDKLPEGVEKESLRELAEYIISRRV
jgi:geranylgeranyl pyrophosphate synthase